MEFCSPSFFSQWSLCVYRRRSQFVQFKSCNCKRDLSLNRSWWNFRSRKVLDENCNSSSVIWLKFRWLERKELRVRRCGRRIDVVYPNRLPLPRPDFHTKFSTRLLQATLHINHMASLKRQARKAPEVYVLTGKTQDSPRKVSTEKRVILTRSNVFQKLYVWQVCNLNAKLGISSVESLSGKAQDLLFKVLVKDRVTLTHSNILQETHAWYLRNSDKELESSPIDVLVRMINSRKFIPASSWVVSPNEGEGIDVSKGTALLKCWSDPINVTKDDVVSVFFKKCSYVKKWYHDDREDQEGDKMPVHETEIVRCPDESYWGLVS